jgi:hypothetical protein
MTTERAPDEAFPSTLEHKHGLSEWWPMLPERSAETIEPGQAPTERIYRCQKIGCTETVRIGAGELNLPQATEPQA